MDLFTSLSSLDSKKPITCIDMHTCGEPTRIVIKGFPELTGTLLEQRSQAQAKHDHIRRRLMLEPRGHFDMYGAILRQQTEFVKTNEADIGVVFMTNDGYSTMCGHATLALGRFLVDTHDETVFPKRQQLHHDAETAITRLKIHAPCGVVTVDVPTLDKGRRSDPSKPVSFISVECFATGLDIKIPLRDKVLCPEGLDIVADFGYGGAFYCLVHWSYLKGLDKGLRSFSMGTANHFAKLIKETVNNDPELRHLFGHPSEKDLSFLYSVIIVDDSLGSPSPGTQGAETGLCFFAEEQVDRSPTGSAVSARLAVAYARGRLGKDCSWTYHSLLSLKQQDPGAAFVGRVNHESTLKTSAGLPIVTTTVEGKAFYTGCNTFIVEDHDYLGDEGFTMKSLAD